MDVSKVIADNQKAVAENQMNILKVMASARNCADETLASAPENIEPIGNSEPLEALVAPIIDWLYNFGSPHTKIIIDQCGVEVMDGRYGIPFKPRD